MVTAPVLLAVALIAGPPLPFTPQPPAPYSEDDPLNEKIWPACLQPRSLHIADDEDQLPRLLKERYNAAQEELRDRYAYWLQDIGFLDQVYAAADRAMKARLAASDPPADEIALLDERLAMARFIENQVAKLLERKKHAATIADQKCAHYHRLDAELAVLRAGEPAAKGLGENTKPRILYLQDLPPEEVTRIVNAVWDDKKTSSVQPLNQTGALLVVSSSKLFTEVQDLATQLQRAAKEPPNEVMPALIPESGEAMRKALEAIIKEGTKTDELKHRKQAGQRQ